jgi:hypothetical protein
MKQLPILITVIALVACGKSKDTASDKTEKPTEPAKKPVDEPKPEPKKEPEPTKDIAKAPDKAATVAIKLDELPTAWGREDAPDGTSKLEVVEGVNGSKFPVDNAVFSFTLGPVTGGNLPKDAAAYGEWHAGQTKTKVEKTEKLGDAVYYEFAAGHFAVVTTVNGTLVSCGGSLYRDKDYDQIPKVRAAVLAQAKKLCASMK